MREGVSRLVLVVDDDARIREALADLLVGEHYEVLTASNGREALKRLREVQGDVDLILLDLSMPVMDGVAFRVEQLADPGIANIPVIVLSANASVIETATVMRTDRCLRKPVQPDALLRAVSSLR
jgi:CheY-like chemotaxis protein